MATRNKVVFKCKPEEEVRKRISSEINGFIERCKPVESELYIFVDSCTNAFFCECHLDAKTLDRDCSLDVPLDPDEQPDYRANREVVEDNAAFLQMKTDAKQGRAFSNVVAEYNVAFDEEHPLKIVGGQHRVIAIRNALKESVNVYHGIKVYFDLNTEQRLDIQIISNTNIDVSSDLLDRMLETVQGPELRNWCQNVGLLEKNEDFADRKKRGKTITVREARTFIINYYLGTEIDKFEDEKTDGVIAKTGGNDDQWTNIKTKYPNLWEDEKLMKAGQEFARLANAQKVYFDRNAGPREYQEKTYNYAIIAAWAFVSGVLNTNNVRLERHYSIPENSKKDPLNAEALSKARHKSDPVNYRGLGTRTDAKERGRLIELFYIQAENGKGISKNTCELALSKYFAKQANLEVIRLEARLNND